MAVNIALAGNPNCGKTTLFEPVCRQLAGSNRGEKRRKAERA